MEIEGGALTQMAYVTRDLNKLVMSWVTIAKAGPFYVLPLPAFEKSYRGKPGKDAIIIAAGFAGRTIIEITQPTNDEPSIVWEILNLKGDGALHHVYPRFCPLSREEFQIRRDEYERAGLKVAVEFDLPGFGKNLYFDALDQLGTFIELAELTPHVFESVERMYEIHRTWDGTRPIRDLSELMRA